MMIAPMSVNVFHDTPRLAWVSAGPTLKGESQGRAEGFIPTMGLCHRNRNPRNGLPEHQYTQCNCTIEFPSF